MLTIRTIPAVRQRNTGVVIATVTRGGRLPYLQRTWKSVLDQRADVPISFMIAGNGIDADTEAWLDKQPRINWRPFSAPHNRGQNITMNEMLDEAKRLNAEWFIRVDDDCFFEKPRQWVKHMLSMQRYFAKNGRTVILGPLVKGLRHPQPALGTMHVRAGKAEIVGILGGICRMMPMPLMRYFRFNERMPMGGGEAKQLASFCIERSIPMVRDCTMTVTHGESTDAQEAANADWAYEHAMLQSIPFGL